MIDDFDAKNHIRDMHRAAETRTLARMAQAGTQAKPVRQPVRLTLVNDSIKLLLMTFVR